MGQIVAENPGDLHVELIHPGVIEQKAVPGMKIKIIGKPAGDQHPLIGQREGLFGFIVLHPVKRREGLCLADDDGARADGVVAAEQQILFLHREGYQTLAVEDLPKLRFGIGSLPAVVIELTLKADDLPELPFVDAADGKLQVEAAYQQQAAAHDADGRDGDTQ